VIRDARAERASDSLSHEMKGFVDVTDNEWFACVTLMKQDWPNAQGSRRKATESHRAQSNP